MKINILQHEFEIEEQDLPVYQLQFSPSNPRVYSILNASGIEPSQEDIEQYMCKMEHVKQLRDAIKAHGGLVDPIFVKDGVVLEGNSRLAAYRLLNKESGSLKWKLIRCLVLPECFDDRHVFALLGQYHIVNRKDWDPYEQAYYLYRRMQAENGTPIEYIARELGITKQFAEKMVSIVQFMHDHADTDKSHWSYYDEYFRSQSLKSFREATDLDAAFVSAVKNNKIRRAEDVRILGSIAKIKDKQSKRMIQKFASGQITLYEAADQIDAKLEDVVKKLSAFKKKIFDKTFSDQLLASPPEVRNNAKYQIKRIVSKLKDLQDLLG